MVIIAGGGLAGLAAAAALGGAGYPVTVLEARRFLGGRATSYEIGDSETIDNCQHILLRCCVNLSDFYRRLGVEGDIVYHRDYLFLEPGGRQSILRAGLPPAPAHLTGSLLRLRFLGPGEKLAVIRALRAIRSEMRSDLDDITMLDWLRQRRQPQRAIERFWKPVLISAISEELDRMSAAHGFQVFRLAFFARKDSYEMGVPKVPLAQLYREEAWRRVGNVEIRLNEPVAKIEIEDGIVRGIQTRVGRLQADAYVCALPFDRLAAVAPGLGLDVSGFEYAPITGIHLWFDRRITDLPQAVLLDRTIQWMFNKHEGRAVQLVVSASRSLLEMPRGEVIDLAVRELGEFFPQVREAQLEKAHVVKEVRAVFSARPGLEALRPGARTGVRNLFLAGDWTRSGWPATMEGAVRSGYLAAEAVAASVGRPERFLLADIA